MEFKLSQTQITILISFVTALATHFILPFFRKKSEWKWEKKKWAEEYFLERISKIKFIAEDCAKSQYDDEHSISLLSFEDANKEIWKTINDLVANNYKIKFYLDKPDRKNFDLYIKKSEKFFNEAKGNYGLWYGDDPQEIERHTIKGIIKQGAAASEALDNLNKFRIFKSLMND